MKYLQSPEMCHHDFSQPKTHFEMCEMICEKSDEWNFHRHHLKLDFTKSRLYFRNGMCVFIESMPVVVSAL